MNQDIYVVLEHIKGELAEISPIMLTAAHSLAEGTGGEVVGVLLGYEAQGLAEGLAANRILYVDHPTLADFNPDAYQVTLVQLIGEKGPRAVLFGNTALGSDIAGVLSARLGLPLINFCTELSPEGKATSRICGGKILAETTLPGTTTLVSMIPGSHKPEEGTGEGTPEIIAYTPPELEGLRTTFNRYIEPEVSDVDISKEEILVGIGRGIQNESNIELAEELAELLGGVVCASRPVVDQGWLPTSRMVGKSGKRIHPKLYLAMGISGAPEHVEGITDSEMIIAVNTDPTAPIFDIAQYGAEIDLLDLTDALLEVIEQDRLAKVR